MSLNDSKNLVLPPLGLGAHQFTEGSKDWYEAYYGKKFLEKPDFNDRLKIVDKALDIGIMLLACDFLPEYEITGKVLKALNRRNEAVISGVVGWRASGNNPDFSGMENALDDALSTGGMECVDILNIRVDTGFMESEIAYHEFIECFERVKKKGKSRFLCIYTGDRDDAVFPLLDRRIGYHALSRAWGFMMPIPLSTCLSHIKMGTPTIALAPFQKGWFFRCASEISDKKDYLSRVAQAALRWMWSRRDNTTVLVGVSSITEMEANWNASCMVFNEEDAAILQRIVQTRAYKCFIERVRIENPGLFFDWRIYLDREDGYGEHPFKILSKGGLPAYE